MVDYLIIGNSAAAIGAVKGIREVDKDGEIVIVSKEPYPTYFRPLITYLLAGQIDESKIFYDPRFYEEHKVEEVLGKKVLSINPKDKKVVLDSKETIPYKKLLIATGGLPIFPQVEGSDLAGVFTFTTLEDAKNVNEFIKKHQVREAIVVGGGLIGLKTAEALIARGIKVTIVVRGDRVLRATFDRKASEIVEQALRDKGCSLITKNTVSKILGQGRVEKIILQDGTQLRCQLLIFAMGVTPNVELAKRAGINVRVGVPVDEYMRTNLPDIYAAGDVVEARDIVLGIDRQIAIWPNAYVQGKIAGLNMAGVTRKYEGSFVMNSVEVCNLPTISVGLTDPKEEGYEILEHYDDIQKTYKKVVLKNDIIVGAIFVKKIDRAGIFTGLIKNKVNVHLFKEALLRDDFGLVWLPETFRKHMIVGEGIEI
jgi:NAD(P)H-nitrite reductase large subunit